ncbi:3-oxoacyl-ACP reductase [candidate division WOR-3 bacterium]|uniref:3-oxoacyl-ACP reductase n=1 Tax=candidate division WOR-3 bacterium TaxID=2052148 RepID=A0A660SE34_UNCW3|nr:MAG: 3-oxoacyl-ACP reductase [candidate division WOR-3 bacterium]
MMRNAFVTGGDRGIGRAIVEMLVAMGHRVVFTYHRNEKAAVRTLKEIGPGKAECYKLDLRDYTRIRYLLLRLKRKGMVFDVVVNNAGILGRFRTIPTITRRDWDEVIAVNLSGPFYLMKWLLPLIRKGGCIINISSIAGKMGGTVGVHYAASKAGLIGFTFALARELAGSGIRVNAIAPGPVDTGLLTPQQKRRLSRLALLKRVARPEEIAHAVRFLIENEYITGEVIDINAGRYMD